MRCKRNTSGWPAKLAPDHMRSRTPETGLIPPRQRRSEHTLAQIMEGTLSLLARRDLDSLSVEEIARASGVAVGSIYRRFRSRDAIVVELLRHVQRQQLAMLEAELDEARWYGKGLEARIAWLAKRQRAAARRVPGLVRAIFASVVNGPAGADEEGVRLNSLAISRIAAWLVASETDARRHARDVEVIVSHLLIGLNLALLYPAAFAPHGARRSMSVLEVVAVAGVNSLAARRS